MIWNMIEKKQFSTDPTLVPSNVLESAEAKNESVKLALANHTRRSHTFKRHVVTMQNWHGN